MAPFVGSNCARDCFTRTRTAVRRSSGLLRRNGGSGTGNSTFNLMDMVCSIMLFVLNVMNAFGGLPGEEVILNITITNFVLTAVCVFAVPVPAKFGVLDCFKVTWGGVFYARDNRDGYFYHYFFMGGRGGVALFPLYLLAFWGKGTVLWLACRRVFVYSDVAVGLERGWEKHL